MHLLRSNAWKRKYVLLVSLLFILTGCRFTSNGGSSGISPTVTHTASTPTPAPSSGQKLPLPGQQIWKNGVSSYLFGTNDSYEWKDNNFETSPAIQKSVRDAGFTLVRTFFPDKASDSDIEKRISAVEASGAQCLGVITNVKNATFNAHLLQYLDKRCQMYEFGNEVDYSGMNVGEYLTQWNNQIPELRKLQPKAIFIGPVTYNNKGRNDFMQHFLEGVKTSQNLPDAVSFHWYPCYYMTRQQCLDVAGTYYDVATGIRDLVKSILGKNLPIGVTEWNFDPSNPPPAYGDDADFIKQFTTKAIDAMVKAGVDFAAQYDAASFSGYGHLDLFNVDTNQPKPQYFALKDAITKYRP